MDISRHALYSLLSARFCCILPSVTDEPYILLVVAIHTLTLPWRIVRSRVAEDNLWTVMTKEHGQRPRILYDHGTLLDVRHGRVSRVPQCTARPISLLLLSLVTPLYASFISILTTSLRCHQHANNPTLSTPVNVVLSNGHKNCSSQPSSLSLLANSRHSSFASSVRSGLRSRFEIPIHGPRHRLYPHHQYRLWCPHHEGHAWGSSKHDTLS